jgi:hypothetical protein
MAQFLLFVAVVLGLAAILRRSAMAETLADASPSVRNPG